MNENDRDLYTSQPQQPGQDPAQQQPAAEQPQPADAAPAADAAAPAAPAPEAPASYPNVGSSGINTANTARTDYAEQPYQGAAGQPAQPEAAGPYTQPGQQAQPGQPPDGAPHGGQYGSGRAAQYDYSGSGPAYGGPQYGSRYAGQQRPHGAAYSYTSTPPTPPQQKPPKQKGGAKKVLLRVVAGLCILALGFAGGLGGAVAADRLGLTDRSVVVQQVQRPNGEDVSQGSAAGASLSLQDVSAMVQPSVVVITTEQMVSSQYIWFGGSYVQSGAGSGVIMTEDGYIITCAHVVEGAQNVRVTLPNGEEYTATIVGGDSTADIAVIKIEATGLTPAVLGDSDALAVGESVVAVGNPLGMLGGTVTNGIVSAINREINVQNNRMTLIQTNAAISPGNSGGGLFNANGELIGIVNAKSSSADSSGNLTDAEGLGFAIPINAAMDIAQDLIDVGYVKRPVLGISVITVDSQELAMQYGVSSFGVYIAQVNEGSGAAKAGLQVGDRISAVGTGGTADIPVAKNSDLTDYLADRAVGDVVTLQIEREGRLLTVEVTLGVSEG